MTATANGTAVTPPPLLPLVPLAAPPQDRHGGQSLVRREAAAVPAMAPAMAPAPAPAAEAPPVPRPAPRRWPLLVIGSGAAVAIWSGWVALGGMCGFGLVQPFPGIVKWHLDTAITLPVSMEAYGAYALGVWLSPGTPGRAKRFAMRSAAGSLALGSAGQVIYHLLAAAHRTAAPWPVVMLVSCIPVAALGMAAALAHLLRAGDGADGGTAMAPARGAVVAVPARPVPPPREDPPNPPPGAATVPAKLAAGTATARRHGGPPKRAPKRPGSGQMASATAVLAERPGLSVSELMAAAGVSETTARRAKKDQAGVTGRG